MYQKHTQMRNFVSKLMIFGEKNDEFCRPHFSRRGTRWAKVARCVGRARGSQPSPARRSSWRSQWVRPMRHFLFLYMVSASISGPFLCFTYVFQLNFGLISGRFPVFVSEVHISSTATGAAPVRFEYKKMKDSAIENDDSSLEK